MKLFLWCFRGTFCGVFVEISIHWMCVRTAERMNEIFSAIFSTAFKPFGENLLINVELLRAAIFLLWSESGKWKHKRLQARTGFDENCVCTNFFLSLKGDQNKTHNYVETLMLGIVVTSCRSSLAVWLCACDFGPLRTQTQLHTHNHRPVEVYFEDLRGKIR